MNCEPVQRVLDAFLDGELDPNTDAEVRRHLAGCVTCMASRDGRDALRGALRRLPRHQAAPQMRLALQRRLDSEGVEPTPAPAGAPRLAAGAGRWPSAARRIRPALWLGTGVAAGYMLALWVAVAPPRHDLREPLLAQHVASFEQGRPRIDVVSSDQHVVKPWFAGKLDFAPTVRDLSQQGFELLGGRLDTVGAQPAAVMVYRVRSHHISLFVSRSQDTERPPAVSTLRGFAVVTWVHDGLTHAAVSDVDARDLRRFSDLMAPAQR